MEHEIYPKLRVLGYDQFGVGQLFIFQGWLLGEPYYSHY